MKKLLIVASVMVAACSLQAASYIWGFQSSDTVAPDGEYFGDGSYADASAFLYLGTASVSGGALDISGLDLVTYVGAMNPDPDYNWGIFGDPMPSSDTVTAAAGANGQAYTLVLVAQGGLSALSDGDAYEMIVANGTSAITAIPGAGDTTYYADFVNGTAFGAGDWQNVTIGSGSASIPEPTSGLLMLLGMAGLALRRRRA